METQRRGSDGRRLFTAEFKQDQIARVGRQELTLAQLSRKSLNDFNLPSGFRREALTASFQGPPVPVLPAAPTLSVADLAAVRTTVKCPRKIPTGTAPSFTVNFQPGAIVQQPGENATAFADRVIDALRQKALAQGVDTLLTGGLN